jgi:hypothetical protein
MISSRRAEEKRIEQFIAAAEKLAAIQYLAGLSSGKPREEKIKQKVNKCWLDFWTARDQLIGSIK